MISIAIWESPFSALSTRVLSSGSCCELPVGVHKKACRARLFSQRMWQAVHERGRLRTHHLRVKAPTAASSIERIAHACTIHECIHSRTRPVKRTRYFSLPYSSSETGSSHSFEQFSPGTVNARCANQLSGAAPCQCFTPVGMFTTSPGSISCAGWPHS